MDELRKWSNPEQAKRIANKYDISLLVSTRKGKKYMVKNPDGKMIHFGALGYEDYTKNQDDKRRDNFRKRNHKWATMSQWTPGWLSYHILW